MIALAQAIFNLFFLGLKTRNYQGDRLQIHSAVILKFRLRNLVSQDFMNFKLQFAKLLHKT